MTLFKRACLSFTSKDSSSSTTIPSSRVNVPPEPQQKLCREEGACAAGPAGMGRMRPWVWGSGTVAGMTQSVAGETQLSAELELCS